MQSYVFMAGSFAAVNQLVITIAMVKYILTQHSFVSHH
jgi:hypothetical protein